MANVANDSAHAKSKWIKKYKNPANVADSLQVKTQ